MFNSNCDSHRNLLEGATPEQTLVLKMCTYLIKGGGNTSGELHIPATAGMHILLNLTTIEGVTERVRTKES